MKSFFVILVIAIASTSFVFAQTPPPGISGATYNSTTGTWFKYIEVGGDWSTVNTDANGLLNSDGWTSKLASLPTSALQSFARGLSGMGSWHIVWCEECSATEAYRLGGSGYGFYECVIKSDNYGAYIAEFVPPVALDITWTGNTSTNWDETGNWSTTTVPTASDNVTIPSSISNYPLIGNGVDAVCNDFGIETGAILSIDQGGTISISGDLTNDGTFNILSDASGEGSLLVDGSLSGTGTYNVERYLTASQWHLVSSPITAGTAGVFHGIWLRAYDESTNTFGEYIVPDATPMPTGQGFSVWTNSAETRTFNGTINNGSVGPLSAQLTGAATANTGWNLMGNPYPSAIDWDAASGWTKTNLANAVYVWNGTQYATYIGGVGANGGSRYIAPTQGFFVQATSAGASLTMNNDVRAHNGVSYLKETSEPTDIIRLNITGNGYSDETVLAVRPGSLNEFDPMTDAVKLPGSGDAPSMFTTKDDETQLAISSLNSTSDIIGKTVQIDYAIEGEHVLSWTHSISGENIPVLYDNLEELVVQAETPYVFVSSLTDPEDRFTFIEMTSAELEDFTTVYTNVYNNVLRVLGTQSNMTPIVQVYNVQGQKVLEFSGTEHGVESLSAGVYLVHVKTDKNEVVEKLIIK